MAEREKLADNVVLVGSKPFMNYTMGVETQLQRNSTVILKARGKFTSKVIDIAEFIKRKSEGEVEIASIKTGTESFEDKEKGREIFVSTIELTLKKK